jgi:hypothetical protein
VTFDGCAPAAACTFDAGAIRIYNGGSSTVHVDQISVHIATCLFTWNGPMYPVTLAPNASLIATRRSTSGATSCTSGDPASFDSSDLPSEGCTNNGVEPVIDVTVDGVTTTTTDSGQVLNSGGIDPGTCSGTNESTEWVPVGSKACPGLNLGLAPATQTDWVGTTASVSATFTDPCGDPLAGVAVEFLATSGPNAGVSGEGITDANGTATFSYSSVAPGSDTLHASVTNAVGFTTSSNEVNVSWIVEYAPGGGSFVIGNEGAGIGAKVNFWGAQWEQHNPLTGGPAPRSFKGYAEDPAVPACGQSWTTDPGNSTPPPDGPLPQLMAVIVTSAVHQAGSRISGNVEEIVIVRTNRGYRPDPGHRGTGTVVSVVCSVPAGGPTTVPNVSAGPQSSAPLLPPASSPGRSNGKKRHGPPSA